MNRLVQRAFGAILVSIGLVAAWDLANAPNATVEQGALAGLCVGIGFLFLIISNRGGGE
jgi:hypothetical protein